MISSGPYSRSSRHIFVVVAAFKFEQTHHPCGSFRSASRCRPSFYQSHSTISIITADAGRENYLPRYKKKLI